MWTGGNFSVTKILFIVVSWTLDEGPHHNETDRIATIPWFEPPCIYAMRSICLQTRQREGVNSRKYPLC